MEKACRKCGEIKPLEDFHSDHRNEDRRTVTCKSCVYARRKVRFDALDPDEQRRWKERGRQYSRNYRASPDFVRKVNRKQWRESDPNKRKARTAVSRARSWGLRIPERCENCDRSHPKLQAHHHHGYEQHHWLDVIWICPSCHGLEHTDA